METEKQARDRVRAQKQQYIDAVEASGVTPDNHAEQLARWDEIEEREMQIAREKAESAKNQEKKLKQAIKEGRYKSDGTPTKRELRRIEDKKAKNRADWAKAVGDNPKKERCPQR